MNSTEIILVALAITAAVAVIAPLVTAALLKKGINLQPVLEKAQSGLDVMQKVVDGISEMAPATPGISTIDKTIGWADKAVEASEQLLNSQQITADQRKANAVGLVESFLKADGITVTPELEEVIDGAVEAAVLALPKTGEEVKAAAAAALAQTTEATEKTTSSAADTATGTAGVTLEALNQAAATINAAIAEKAATEVTTEDKTTTPGTTGATGQASV